MINLGDAVLFFRGDHSDIDKSADHVSDISKNIGLGFALVGGAITGAMGFALKAFADSEKAGAQLDAVLKSTGGAAGMTREALDSLATELQRTTAFEDDAVARGEAMLLTFTNIGKDVFPMATRTMLDMSTAMNQDLQSSAIQLGKALNDPIAGISALSRVGVQFTDSQKEQIQVLMQSGNVMGAQKIILAELSKEFGGSAVAAADTLTGKWEQLKNEFGNMMEDIGNALTDGGGFKGLLDTIKNIVISVDDWMKANQPLTKDLVLLTAGVGGLMFFLGPMLYILPGIATGIGLVGAAFEVLSLGPIAVAVAALVAVGVIGYGTYKLLTGTAVESNKKISTSNEKTWGELLDLMTGGALKDEQTKAKLADYSTVTGASSGAAEEVVNGWFKSENTVESNHQKMLDILAKYDKPTEAAKKATEEIGGSFTGLSDLVYMTFQDMWNQVMNTWSGVKSLFGSVPNSGGGTAAGQETQFRASGGPVSSGSPYIVGEEGPEMFVPSTAGTIINARDTARGTGAGGSVTINFPNLTIREEADIGRISQLLAREIPMAMTRALA